MCSEPNAKCDDGQGGEVRKRKILPPPSRPSGDGNQNACRIDSQETLPWGRAASVRMLGTAHRTTFGGIPLREACGKGASPAVGATGRCQTKSAVRVHHFGILHHVPPFMGVAKGAFVTKQIRYRCTTERKWRNYDNSETIMRSRASAQGEGDENRRR